MLDTVTPSQRETPPEIVMPPIRTGVKSRKSRLQHEEMHHQRSHDECTDATSKYSERTVDARAVLTDEPSFALLMCARRCFGFSLKDYLFFP
jgi:hypothetical protein